MEKLRDYFWIWGHPVNSLHGIFGLKDESKMTPYDAMRYLGAQNILYVPMGRTVNKEEESTKMNVAREFGWSLETAATHSENVFELAALAMKYPKLKKVMFDDFFNEENGPNNYLNYTPKMLSAYRDKLHAAEAEMWMVLYSKQLFCDLELEAFINEFDGVSLWFWEEKDIADFELYVHEFFRLTEGKQRMLGCYMYDFGAQKPSSDGCVTYQLDKSREFILSNKTQGVMLHTNVIADLGFAAVEEARAWLEAHGDEAANCFV
ncbi:MAG TPA: hypothetical protein PLT66_04515 [Bacillota bacterium]|nr:hypothetical protein [Bacillota bacterium]